MKRAAQNAKASSSMQEVIDVSDDEPTEKSLKRDPEPVPPPPTPEVIELRQKMAKMEENLQGALRFARTWELKKEKAEERIAVLEAIIEKKPKVADDATRKANDELQKKIDVLTQQRDDFECESVQLKSRLADISTKLEKAIASQKQFSKNALKMGQEAISHAVEVKEWKRKMAAVEAEKNILKLCILGSPDTISYESAVGQLRAKYHRGNKEWWSKYKQFLYNEGLPCKACNKKSLTMFAILEHFFGSIHADMARNSAVSLVAFTYWMRKLDSIPTPSAVAPSPFPPVVAMLTAPRASPAPTVARVVTDAPAVPRVAVLPTVPRVVGAATVSRAVFAVAPTVPCVAAKPIVHTVAVLPTVHPAAAAAPIADVKPVVPKEVKREQSDGPDGKKRDNCSVM